MLLLLFVVCGVVVAQTSDRSEAARRRVEPRIRREFAERGLNYGSPVFLRAFKAGGRRNIDALTTQRGYNIGQDESGSTIEIWVQHGATYKLYKSFPVCAYSGVLGTKTRQGDGQTPEGLYEISRFNPWSSYHLSFDIGYPNALERRKGYTGGDIMVHGICGSIGCFAVQNGPVEDIYTVVYNARKNGQRKIPFHSYPFPMSEANIQAGLLKFPTQRDLWSQLKPAYDAFESTRVPPTISWAGTRYGVTVRGAPSGREPVAPISPIAPRPPQTIPVEPRDPPARVNPSRGSGPWKYQVGAFSNEANARRLVAANPDLEVSFARGLFFVRSIQRFPSAQAAEVAASRAGHNNAATVRT